MERLANTHTTTSLCDPPPTPPLGVSQSGTINVSVDRGWG
eukprot:SAG25_NODE_15179_length_154_cov_211.618182_1_plen_39_part_01